MSNGWTDTLTSLWHADDCHGGCDGCGHIAEDGFWYAGPTPEHLVSRQAEWSE